MRPYEMMYILQPNLSAEEHAALVNRFNEVIGSYEGTVENTDIWGNRQLAYDIKGFRDGYYVLVMFQGTPELADELDRQFRLTEQVLRHIVLRRDEK